MDQTRNKALGSNQELGIMDQTRNEASRTDQIKKRALGINPGTIHQVANKKLSIIDQTRNKASGIEFNNSYCFQANCDRAPGLQEDLWDPTMTRYSLAPGWP